ncbi:MAG: CPBP family intramembrane metalloprotease [Solirubrobacterales bacterium]|nr:CPBP family intramembrane metalloprotease [Solirubrobacterales bacterium]
MWSQSWSTAQLAGLAEWENDGVEWTPERPADQEAPPPVEGPVGEEDRDTFPYATWGPFGAVGMTLLALFAGMLASVPFYLIGGIESEQDVEGATAIAVQAVTGLGLALIPIIFAWSWSGGLLGGFRALGFRSFDIGRAAAWAAGAVGLYFAFAILYSVVVGQPEQEEIIDRFGPLGFQILLIVVLAPLAEEIAFRGLLFGGLRRRLPMIPAALIGGLFFGLLHFSTGWSAVPVLIFLGTLFAILYEKTGSLWPPIILHAINNGFAMVVLSAS